MIERLFTEAAVELTAEARLAIPGEGIGFAPVGPSPCMLRRIRFGIELDVPKRVTVIFELGRGK